MHYHYMIAMLEIRFEHYRDLNRGPAAQVWSSVDD